MSNLEFSQIRGAKLKAGIGASDTTIRVSGFLDSAGDALTMAAFGDKGYATIEPRSSNRENISFTGITDNGDETQNLTGVTRGLEFTEPYTENTLLKKSHAANVSIIVTDNAPFLDALKQYFNDLANAGAANASETQNGIVELPTVAQIDADTATGETGAALVPGLVNLAASKYGTRLPTTEEKAFLSDLQAGTLKSVIRYYTSNATWTKPAGLSHIDVELVGGGGGGGGVTSAEGRVGGGGGAGAYSRARFLASALSATESVSIGAAGTGGANGANGTSGGTTTFKSCNGAGGSGGEGSTTGDGSSAGGAGGASGSGDITFLGQDGGGGMGDSDTTVDIAIGGYGGSSYFGGGGRQVTTGFNQVAGVNAKSYGSGGSGAATKRTTQAAGGNGAGGLVILTEYFI